MTETIAVLGTGIMGGRMATRLLAAGYAVRAWNRTPAKAAPLVERGAVLATTPRDACTGATLAIVMLSDAPSVEAVLFDQGGAQALAPGSLVMDMGSNSPAVARDHAQRLGAIGVRHVDAPVSGGPGGAEQGTLAIMVGGNEADFARAAPVLTRLGRPTLVGPSGSGQLAKLCNQTIVGLTIGAVAEAVLLAEAGGADPAKVREALTGGYADSLILKVHGQRMINRSFEPGGPSRLQLKDLHNILDAAKSSGLHLPLATLVTRMYESLVANGGAELDHSALLLEIERMNHSSGRAKGA
jgi:2-hydroxy-3-oxopropionate reductase